MASKAAMIGSTDPTEPGMAAEEREGLLHPSREQEIRNLAARDVHDLCVEPVVF
jgi:hypothetical protein